LGLPPKRANADDTFAKLLRMHARVRGGRPAFRHKDFGIWQTWTWSQVYDETRALAQGLDAMGLRKGDRIAIVGANRPRLYWAITAAQMLGAVPVPVYADSVADEMAAVLDHAGAKFIAAQDQEQVDKIFSVASRLPNLAHVIYDEERGLGDYGEARLHSFDAVMAAYRLPHRSDAERATRGEAVQAALIQATDVPLEIARRAADLLPVARELVETGNANAVSDAYSAGQTLHAAVAGGLANVSINLAARTDTARIDAVRDEAERVRERAAATLADLETAFRARLTVST